MIKTQSKRRRAAYEKQEHLVKRYPAKQDQVVDVGSCSRRDYPNVLRSYGRCRTGIQEF